VVPDNETISRALAMAQQIAELPPLAVQQIKEIILAGEDGSLEEGLRLEAKAIQLMFSSQDQKEGMAAFIEKRKAKFQGK
jgi:enoyl-CoA hydratase/carnithine racemase